MVGTIRLLIYISLLALSACGGGGGGSSSSSSSSGSPPPTIILGSFTGPEASFSFNGGAIVGTGTNSASGAQVTVSGDPTTGTATSIMINVPAGSGPPYVHTFDLTSAAAATGPFSGFISAQDGVNTDGSFRNQIFLDPTLNFSSYGLWTNSPSSATAGTSGALAFGQLTPAANIPKTGSLVYSGRTIGAMVDGTKSTPLIGTETLTANFAGSPTVTGTFAVSTVAPGGATTPWANLGITGSGAGIVGNAYSGTVSGTILSGTNTNGTVTGPINGNFYGSAVNETAGTWSVTDGATIHAIGAFGAKR